MRPEQPRVFRYELRLLASAPRGIGGEADHNAALIVAHDDEARARLASRSRAALVGAEPSGYVAIDRRDAIQPAFEVLLGVVDEVISIELADVERVREFVLGVSGLSARDSLHAAVMTRNNIELIMTFGTVFDAVPGMSRFRA